MKLIVQGEKRETADIQYKLNKKKIQRENRMGGYDTENRIDLYREQDGLIHDTEKRID